ncbi:uncharacterized protein LOC110055941 isoform X2 [Orbicella faveolata]|uniref:uncharacterized protein LOC110055941 isoform X1 n=1 Tax=Orbicella faveolata TaxID=48498 RepID=UPI0009E4397C|nr:uncharacterized protein LOC110055941 isoform X1 [Orbicella faveolata]XP_020618041.1 uncharacterized protein LOC110055941 isoform X2 [Orbicella faveolata]
MAKFYFLPALFLMLCYSVVTAGYEGRQIDRECKPFPYSFFESASVVMDFVRWIAWFFRNLLSATYFLLNTVVITACEIISSIFSIFRHAIKLVEYLGYCVRAILQVNYNFVSSVFVWLAKLAGFLTDTIRYIAEGIISVISSTFRLILRLIRSIVSSIPAGFYRAFYGASSAKNTTGILLHQSYLGWKYILKTPSSALMTLVTSIRAVMECILVSMWNAGVLLVELLCAVAQSTFRGIEFVGKSVHTCTVSAWHQIITFLNMLLHGLRSLVIAIGKFFLFVGRTFLWLITFIFRSLAQGVSTFFSMTGWLFAQAFNCVYRGLIEVGRWLLSCLIMLQNVITAIAYCLPGGRWTLLSLVSSTFLIAYAWSALRVNVFTIAYGLLERYIQGVLAYLATLQTPSMPRFKKTFPTPEESCEMPLDEKDRDLREELERERDKNLCVVCQTENKNIVVMPCRHMCMCKNCCTQLFRIHRYHRRTCPLCRHIITSTMEIYS